MPCESGPDIEGSGHDSRMVREATRLLCILCKHLEDSERLEDAPCDIQEWWIEHKKADLERVQSKLQELKLAQKKIRKLKKLVKK